jgi:hypothetical protein
MEKFLGKTSVVAKDTPAFMETVLGFTESKFVPLG